MGSRGKKGKDQKGKGEQKLSQRQLIVQYRKTLHGEVAKAFDEVFYDEAGCDKSKGIRAALNKTSGSVHKAFTAAKAAVDKLPKEVRERDIGEDESESSEGEESSEVEEEWDE